MDKQERKRLLREYMAIPRVSGYEGEMARRLAADFGEYADSVTTDRVGNVIASFKGKNAAAPSLMVFAHMDTIGFIITAIDENGFLRADRMGGVPEKMIAGTELMVGTEQGTYVPGIIAAKAYHVQTPEEKSRADSLSSLFIDVGVESREEANELGVYIGCPAAYAPRFMELPHDRIAGSYLDDASGMVTLLELARYMKDNRPGGDVHLVGTVWEEFNARGAMIAERTAKADMAVCLLGPGACDTPDLRGKGEVKLGGGPAVTLFNFHGKGTLNGCVAHKGMFERLKSCAKENGIPLQRSAGRGALSDAAYLQLENLGLPCVDMGCPDRYSHSMLECISLYDHELTGRLLAAFIASIEPGFRLERY